MRRILASQGELLQILAEAVEGAMRLALLWERLQKMERRRSKVSKNSTYIK